MTAEADLMTAQELLQYSHEPYRQELVDGILYEMEPPGALHGFVSTAIGELLRRHVTDAGLGVVFTSEVGFHLSSGPDTVHGPDVSFVPRARVDEIGMVLHADEQLDLGDVVPGWSPRVGDFFV